MTLQEVIKRFGTDEQCREHLEKLRWPKGLRCVECGSERVYPKPKRKQYECYDCKRRFSVLHGTSFAKSKIPLPTWFLAIHRFTESKKGVSANQLKRELGVTYKTAWFMVHRIRESMNEPIGRLKGKVEIDDTYAGTRRDLPRRTAQGRKMRLGGSVVGMKERGGKIRAEVTPDLRRRTVAQAVVEGVDLQESEFLTDPAHTYKFLGKHAPHRTVNHGRTYVAAGNIHTNNVESFWSLLKRGIRGNFHHVSAKHLHGYVDEFEYRHNHRNGENLVDSMLRNAEGRRLTYAELISEC